MFDMIKGYEWRERQEMRKYAQLASWISHINFIKKPLEPNKLIPDETKHTKISREEGQRLKDELLAQMGAKAGEQ